MLSPNIKWIEYSSFAVGVEFLVLGVLVLRLQFFQCWPLDQCKIWHFTFGNLNLSYRLAIEGVEYNIKQCQRLFLDTIYCDNVAQLVTRGG